MQQGLGALMPQQPAGQAPENPVRMAAAMDVVTSDAEEQVLDPRTLALIKYKDAVAAMQAADQLMAASQPTPTPPTVAERTKLAAQQGIMGLASRLAPGLQQQGSRMGAAQAQQAMTGGLTQLPAPNVAGMAGGGIVGYAEGGAVDTDVQRYTEQYRAIMAAVQNASTPEQKAQLQQRLREIQSTFDPETIARAHMQMSGQGMAAGGEVRGFAEGRKVEKAQPAIGSAYIDPVTGEVLPVSERFGKGLDALREFLLGKPDEGFRGPLTQEQFDESALRNAPGAPLLNEPTAEVTVAPTAQEAGTNGSTINLSSLDRDRQERSSPRVTSETPENAGLASLIAYANSQTGTPTATQSDFDRRVEQAALNRLEGALDYDPEKTRLEEEARARTAYGVPAELTELLRARSAALDAPLYSPEEQRGRELRALLGGLASSGYIAESGPAASRAIMGIEDEVRADARTRAEKQFDLAASLIEQERAARQSVYTAGQEAMTRAETGANQAMQSAVAQLNSQNEVAAAQALQQQQMQFDVLKAQMDEATEQQRLGILDRQTQATLANSISSVMDNVQTAAGVLRQTLATTPDDADKTSIRDAITGMEARLEALVTQFNELTGVRPAPIETPTPTGEFDISPEADEAYNRYNTQ